MTSEPNVAGKVKLTRAYLWRGIHCALSAVGLVLCWFIYPFAKAVRGISIAVVWAERNERLALQEPSHVE